MQYKVPQNVDIEDRVIAGLTLRQFGFLMVAGALVLALKFTLVGTLSFLFLPLAIIIGGAGIAFAFVKINDRPFELFVIAAARTLFTPGKRYWEKDTEVEIPKHTETPHNREAVKSKKNVKDVRSSLERLATVVDSGGTVDLLEDVSRAHNIKNDTRPDPIAVADILQKTEEPQEHLDKYLEEAKSYVKENAREKPVSTMATTNTSPDNFEYEKLELADEKKLESILEKAEEEQKTKDQKLHSAKIIKFGHEEIK
jgi:hypothetical protein